MFYAQFSHTFFMEKCRFLNSDDFDFTQEFFECETCGNHVCKSQAEIWSRICPNCFGRLYRIS